MARRKKPPAPAKPGRKSPRKPAKPSTPRRRRPPRRPTRPRPPDQVGRGPNRWEPRKVDIKAACKAISEKGATIESVSRPYLQAAPSTVFKYLKANPTSLLSESIDEAIAIANLEDEGTLLKMSKKDFRALRLRLLNRNPDAWRDRVTVSGDAGGAPVEIAVGATTRRGPPKDHDETDWRDALAAAARALGPQPKAKG